MGFEDIYRMYPMDFEESLWAVNVQQTIFSTPRYGEFVRFLLFCLTYKVLVPIMVPVGGASLP